MIKNVHISVAPSSHCGNNATHRKLVISCSEADSFSSTLTVCIILYSMLHSSSRHDPITLNGEYKPSVSHDDSQELVLYGQSLENAVNRHFCTESNSGANIGNCGFCCIDWYLKRYASNFLLLFHKYPGCYTFCNVMFVFTGSWHRLTMCLNSVSLIGLQWCNVLFFILNQLLGCLVPQLSEDGVKCGSVSTEAQDGIRKCVVLSLVESKILKDE